MAPPGQTAVPVRSCSTSSGTRTDTQQAIRAVHAVLDATGTTMSPCKVNRLVRQLEMRVQGSGFNLLDLLADRLDLTREQRQALNPDLEFRTTWYPDRTPEEFLWQEHRRERARGR